MATDSVKISVDAHGNAVEELKRVRRAMAANEKELVKLTGAGAKSEAQSKKSVSTQERLAGAMKHAQVAAGLLAAAMAARAFAEFVIAGEKAANVAVRFAQAVPDAERSLVALKAATAGLVTETDLQVTANRFIRLGVSIDDTRRLMELATKAAMDQGREVMDVVKILETAVRGETTGLLEIGVNLEETTTLTKAYAKETGRTEKEIGKMEQRLKVALPAALKALGKQFDGVDLRDFRIEMQQATNTFSDFTSDVQAFVAEGWGDAFRAITPIEPETIDSTTAALERSTRTVNLMSAAVAAGMDNQRDLVTAFQDQREDAKRLAMQLAKLPIAEQAAAVEKMNKAFGKTGAHVVTLVKQFAGLTSNLNKATHASQKLLHELAIKPPSMKWWDDWIKDVTKGLDAHAAAAKRRAAAAVKAIRQTRAAAQEQAKNLSYENDHAGRMAHAATELARIDEISRRAKEVHEQKMAKLEAKNVTAKTINKLNLEFEIKHNREMAKLRDAAHKADEERLRLAATATTERAAALRLARVDAQLSQAVEPLERARLELMRARIEASLTLRTLSDNETDAAIQRIEAQTQLNAAMSIYNQELARASSAGWVTGLTSVADAMADISGKAGAIGSIGESLSTVSDAVGRSSGVWAQYADSQIGVGDAVGSTIGVLGDAAGSFIEDEKSKAAIASAFQAAASIGAFASGNIASGIAHAAAATAFAAVAAGAGGGASAAAGGGGGGASGGAASASDQKGGFGDGDGRQVIIQFGSGVILGSAAQVGAAIQQAEYANRGTGHAAGY